MKKIYAFFVAFALVFAANAQSTTIDIAAIDTALTVDFQNDLVIDVVRCTSAIANPALSYANPFKGQTFSEAEISFDVYNYDQPRFLGALLSIYDPALGRLYFTNGSYLGFNNGKFVDGNMVNFVPGVDFIGTNAWKNVQIQFTSTSFAVYMDGVLAYSDTSTTVPMAGDLTDYNEIITFLQNAQTLAFGTGSWWSDNIDTAINQYYDHQLSYMKNITFTPNFSTVSIDDELEFIGEVIETSFISIDGKAVGNDFNSLSPGVYIKRETYSNGAIRMNKVGKLEY